MNSLKVNNQPNQLPRPFDTTDQPMQHNRNDRPINLSLPTNQSTIPSDQSTYRAEQPINLPYRTTNQSIFAERPIYFTDRSINLPLPNHQSIYLYQTINLSTIPNDQNLSIFTKRPINLPLPTDQSTTPQDCLVGWLRSRQNAGRSGGRGDDASALQSQKCELCRETLVFKARYRPGAPGKLGLSEVKKDIKL